MGPFSESRLQSHQPAFSNVVSNGTFFQNHLRRKVKRYGVIFTFLDCRAVYLKVTHSMDFASFIMAFTWFVDLQVLPTAMSDVTALVNARPLTIVSVVPYDSQPLIPNPIHVHGIE
jgi:hypothetical protein